MGTPGPVFQGARRAGRGCPWARRGRGHPTPSGEAPTLGLCVRPRLPVSGCLRLSLCIPQGSLPCGAWPLLWVPLLLPGSQALTPIPSPPGSGPCLPRAVPQVLDSSAFLSHHLCVCLCLSPLSQGPCVSLCLSASSHLHACVLSPPCPSPLSPGFPSPSLGIWALLLSLSSSSPQYSRLTLLLHTFVSAPGTGRPGGRRSALQSRLPPPPKVRSPPKLLCLLQQGSHPPFQPAVATPRLP